MLHIATALLADTVKHAIEMIDAASPTAEDAARLESADELERILVQLQSKVTALRETKKETGADKTEILGAAAARPSPIKTQGGSSSQLLPWQKKSRVAPVPSSLAIACPPVPAVEVPSIKGNEGKRGNVDTGLLGLRQWDQKTRTPPSQSRRISFLSAVRGAYAETGGEEGIGTQMSLPIEEYLPGSVIVEQDVYLRCMYIIKSGTVEILKNDTEKPIAELDVPAYFGEISLFCGRPTTATVRAKTATTVYVLPRVRLSILRDKFPEVIQMMLQTAARRLKEDILRTIANKDSNRANFNTMLEVIDKQLVKLDKKQTYLLHPHSKAARIWEWLMAWCLLYVLIVTPYESAFLKPKLNTLFWFNRIVDFIYLIDMILSFFLIYELNNHDTLQVFVKDHRKIALRYLKTYFFVDFAALLACPLDIVAVQNDSGGFFGARLLRLCKIFRLLKVQQFISSTRIFRILETSYVSYRMMNLLALLVFLVTLSHCMACTAGLMAKVESADQKTWVTAWADGIHEVDREECMADRLASGSLKDAGAALEVNAAYWEDCYTPHSLYIACLYWAVMTVRALSSPI
jgi:hypothetical protein